MVKLAILVHCGFCMCMSVTQKEAVPLFPSFHIFTSYGKVRDAQEPG